MKTETKERIKEIILFTQKGEIITKLRLEQEEYNRIRETAKKRGESVQEFFIKAFDDYIETIKKRLEK